MNKLTKASKWSCPAGLAAATPFAPLRVVPRLVYATDFAFTFCEFTFGSFSRWARLRIRRVCHAFFFFTALEECKGGESEFSCVRFASVAYKNKIKCLWFIYLFIYLLFDILLLADGILKRLYGKNGWEFLLFFFFALNAHKLCSSGQSKVNGGHFERWVKF